MLVRQQVNKALERSREQGVVRGSLDAAVSLYAESDLAARLGGDGGGRDSATGDGAASNGGKVRSLLAPTRRRGSASSPSDPLR